MRNISTISELREALKADPLAKLSVIAAIANTLRLYDLNPSVDLIRDLQITTDTEIGISHEVVLPVGTPCGWGKT